MTTRARLALAAVLGLAGVLRFSGLGWGLRHPPQHDERVFVEAALTMAARGSLDPGWYGYPGLVFVLLKAVFGVIPGSLDGANAYLVARAVVATLSVASVGLLFLLGRRLMGESPGLVAALLLAVSPAEVQTAHMVRPDVVLGTLVLLALFWFTDLGRHLRHDAQAGLSLGAVLATKFTGVALLPAWLLARCGATGPRLRGLALGGLCALVVLVATTPTLVSDPGRLFEGVVAQRDRMFDADRTSASPIVYYGERYLRSLGPIASLLAALGLLVTLRAPGGLLPALVYAAGMLLVLSSAPSERFERLIVSTLGIAALLAVRGLIACTRRAPALIWPAACLAAVLPAWESLDYARAMRLPLTRDLALDYLEGTLPRGASVLSGVPELGLDRFAYDVAGRSGEPALDHLAARRADAVVSFESERPPGDEGLVTVFRALPATDWNGATILVQRAPPERRVTFIPLASQRFEIRSRPSSRGGLAALEVALPSPVEVACLELRFAGKGAPPTRRLHLQVRSDAGFETVPAMVGAGCGPARAGERRRALILVPRRVQGLRVEVERDTRLPLAGVRLYRLGRGGLDVGPATSSEGSRADPHPAGGFDAPP